MLHLVTKFNLMSALCPGLRLHDNEYVSQVLKSLNRIYNILDTEGITSDWSTDCIIIFQIQF